MATSILNFPLFLLTAFMKDFTIILSLFIQSRIHFFQERNLSKLSEIDFAKGGDFQANFLTTTCGHKLQIYLNDITKVGHCLLTLQITLLGILKFRDSYLNLKNNV